MTLSRLSSAFALMLLAATGFAGLAHAGSFDVAPGATANVDTADRGGYTTITVTNRGNAAGRLTIAGAAVDVPANGRIELYDRYGNGMAGRSTVAVTNSGSTPLHILSRYQFYSTGPNP